MSLLAYKGSFNAEIATGSKAYSGVGFQPKAILFWLTRQASTGFATNRTFSYGAATSSAEQWVFSTYSADNVGVTTALGQRQQIDGCISGITVSAGTVSSELLANLTSFDADGFTLEYTITSAGMNYIVHYLALGGTDVTNAKAGVLTSPTSTGNQSYTDPGFKPDLLLTAGMSGATMPLDAGVNRLGIGAGKSAAMRAAIAVNEDAVNPTAVNQWQVADRILQTTTGAGGTSYSADLVTMDDTGFTLSWTTVLGTARYFGYLALKGGSYAVVTDTQKTSTGTKAMTGLGFRPVGLLLMGVNAATNASVDTTQSKLTVGASDGTRQGATWGSGTDNVATTDENIASRTDKAIVHATNSATINAEADVSFDADGYSLNWTTADATAREFIAIAFGSVVAATPQLLSPSADSIDGTWTDQAGGTDLYSRLDEASADDSDYIQSVTLPDNTGCRVKLNGGTDPGSSGGHYIRWRIRKDAPAGATLNMTVKLRQGGGNLLGAGTLIASFTESDVNGSYWITHDYELTAVQADTITDYSDLYLEFFADVP